MGVLLTPASSLVKKATQPPQNVTTELAELNREVKTKVIPHIIELEPSGWLVVQIQSAGGLGVS